MAVGAFITPGRSIERAIEHVRLAESLGYDALYTTHIAGFESLTVLAAYATATERIRLGTGVVPIYTRTPATMAQTALTLDAISGGRLNLGLGVSHRVVVEHWHGQSIDRPVAEMREYIAIVRAILAGEDPPAGEKWRTAFHLMGVEPRPQLPIYVAALSPAMLRAAGEIADGVLLWLCVPEYIASVVIPAVREGRERAGKDLEGFDIVPAVPCAVPAAGKQSADVLDGLRGELLTYFGLPFYRAMIERAGFAQEIAAFDQAAGAGDSAAMRAAISDRFLSALAGIGEQGDVRAAIERYRAAGATTPCVGPAPHGDLEATLRAAIS
ncbi:MAG TPA: LLM class flavin-dependent oxidoreductase [Solirubrobacteraceae bacterium]|nr:LLM class flavin-dependent oxidoreductase [Solirubrobacteraceae bacterium]